MDHQSQSRYSEEEYPDSYDKPTGSQRNTQPGFRHQGYLTPLTSTSRPYVSPYPPTRQPSESSSLSQKPKPSRASTPGNIGSSEASSGRSSLVTAPMSTYSSSSQESTYSSPAPQQYKLVSPGMMSNPKSMTSVSRLTCFSLHQNLSLQCFPKSMYFATRPFESPVAATVPNSVCLEF